MDTAGERFSICYGAWSGKANDYIPVHGINVCFVRQYHVMS